MSRAAIWFTHALFGVCLTAAHPGLELGMEQLNGEIAGSPRDAELYLKRGELYAQHEDPVQAEANFLRAAELSPALPGLRQSRGQLALAQRQFSEALVHLNQALVEEPTNTSAQILRARVYTALKNIPAALADYAAASSRLTSVHPELVLEHARILPPSEALQHLDRALTQIGYVPALLNQAIAIALSLGLTDEALRWLDHAVSTSERPELGLKRRGDILAAAGRRPEAIKAYLNAQKAINNLPPWLRESPEITQLSSELSRLTASQS